MAKVSKRITVVLSTETHELRVAPDADTKSEWLSVTVVPIGELPDPVELGRVAPALWESFVTQVEIARRASDQMVER